LALVLQSIVFELLRLALVLKSIVFELPRHNLSHYLLLLLSDIAFWAMLLVPIAALLRRDLSTVLSNDYRRVVAGTPHIRVRAKLPLAVKCVMALFLFIAIGAIELVKSL